MVRNDYLPAVAVPVEPGPVTVDGAAVDVHEADALPLTRLHFLG